MTYFHYNLWQKVWDRIKKFKILIFRNLLSTWLWRPVVQPRKFLLTYNLFGGVLMLLNLNLHAAFTPLWYRFPIEDCEIPQRGMMKFEAQVWSLSFKFSLKLELKLANRTKNWISDKNLNMKYILICIWVDIEHLIGCCC